MSIKLFFLVFLISRVYNKELYPYEQVEDSDSSEPGFVKEYQVKVIKKGDGLRHPKIGNKVFYHYKSWDPETGRVYEPKELIHGKPRTLTIARTHFHTFHPKCHEHIFQHMTEGEILQVVCQPPQNGGFGHAKPPHYENDKPVAFEIELVEIHGRARKPKVKDEL